MLKDFQQQNQTVRSVVPETTLLYFQWRQLGEVGVPGVGPAFDQSCPADRAKFHQRAAWDAGVSEEEVGCYARDQPGDVMMQLQCTYLKIADVSRNCLMRDLISLWRIAHVACVKGRG